MPMLSIQSLVQMSSTHIYSRVWARNAFSVCIFVLILVHFKKQRRTRKKKKLEHNNTREIKKKTNAIERKKSLAYSYCYSFLVVFIILFSCCLFLAYIHPSQFICRLLFFIMMLQTYNSNPTRDAERCNIVFIVCTYCCELFLFPPIF